MPNIFDLYSQSLSMLTDLYQLTMAYGYWKTGTANKETVFHLFFRKAPFQGGYTINCGLEYVIGFLERFSFNEIELEYLGTLKGHNDQPLFEKGFLDYLKQLKFTCDVDAIPEGTVVFPQEPLVRVKGPIIQCQLLESALLNIINFQTLIATKAARIKEAAGNKPVIEFGMRRAHGFDGGVTASRAGYVGGADGSSNVLAGMTFGIPIKGTHSHSWVMSFPDELTAFKEYAAAMPNNCVFLVDTYDTLNGVDNAIEAGRWLRQHGHELIGIRLDSGDLAYLSIRAREKLDEAGFFNTKIMASNDLDEHIIASLNLQGAKIDSFGVGTKLATAYDQPALGGVYKLGAVRTSNGPWQYRLKTSEQQSKISNPGILQVRRYNIDGQYAADAIYDNESPPQGDVIIVDPIDITRRKIIHSSTPYHDLLVPVFRNGKCVYDAPSLNQIKEHCHKDLSTFHPGIKRFMNPHRYPAGLESNLHELKMQLVLEARGLPS